MRGFLSTVNKLKFFNNWSITAFFILFLLCSQAQQIKGKENGSFIEIESFLQSLIDTAGIPGICIAITKGQEIVYSRAFGFANLQTREKLETWHIFHIASVSKTFAATAVIQLAEKGKIDIDEPLIRYLPYFKLDDERYKKITIKQMLNHTSRNAGCGRL